MKYSKYSKKACGKYVYASGETSLVYQNIQISASTLKVLLRRKAPSSLVR